MSLRSAAIRVVVVAVLVGPAGMRSVASARAVPGVPQETFSGGVDLSSPERAYETCVGRLLEDPESVLETCFTREGRERFLLSLVLVATMAEGFAELDGDPEELERVRSVLEEHGLDRDLESEAEFARAVADLEVAAFVRDVLELRDVKKEVAAPGSGSIRDVEIDGDRATGIEVFPGGDGGAEQRLTFVRVDGRWRLHDWESEGPGSR